MEDYGSGFIQKLLKNDDLSVKCEALFKKSTFNHAIELNFNVEPWESVTKNSRNA